MTWMSCKAGPAGVLIHHLALDMVELSLPCWGCLPNAPGWAMDHAHRCGELFGQWSDLRARMLACQRVFPGQFCMQCLKYQQARCASEEASTALFLGLEILLPRGSQQSRLASPLCQQLPCFVPFPWRADFLLRACRNTTGCCCHHATASWAQAKLALAVRG